MQSIERYGLVALLFLVVTIIAVLVWDEDLTRDPSNVAHAKTAALDSPQPTLRAGKPRVERRVTPAGDGQGADRVQLQVAPKPRGLSRRDLEQQRKLEAQRALAAAATQEASPGAGLVPASEGTRRAGKGRRNTPKANPVESAQVAAGGTREGARPVERRQPEPSLAQDRGPGAGGRATYVVQAGDTLGEIAQRELGTVRLWKEIVALNPDLNPDRIVVGQVLVMPAAGVEVASGERNVAPERRAPRREHASKPGPAGTYHVAPGDSLWKIAQRELGDGERWREIADLNPKLTPDKLLVGQRLSLPRAGAARVAEASSSRGSQGAPVPGQLVAANAVRSGSSRGRVR